MLIRHTAAVKRGRAVASILQGAWRPTPHPLDLSAETLRVITPTLLNNGVAALCWWRIRRSALAATPAALPLRAAYRGGTLQTVMQQRELQNIHGALQQAGLDAMLFKGWATARLYPEPGLRPFGDFDFVVRPEQYMSTLDLLTRAGKLQTCDVKPGLIDELPGRRFDSLYPRSHVIALGVEQIRILGPEDHLRLACLHYVKHGGHRALWLCDIALLIESRPPDFDWHYLLSGPRWLAEWVICILGLAHHLLGARLDDTPLRARTQSLPRWLIPATLYEWGSPFSLVPEPAITPDTAWCTRLRVHWNTPIRIAWRFQLRPSFRLVGLMQAGRFLGR
ncbi:MAG TPA: nucleotidyltransferase family protein, partial [Chloroflexota bacterium]|nr:nucleotidyltransferase family protein [Chloroflexota bacterium]